MYPKNNLSYVGNFMHMMWGFLPKSMRWTRSLNPR